MGSLRIKQNTARPPARVFDSRSLSGNQWGCNPSNGVAYSPSAPQGRKRKLPFDPQILAFADSIGWSPKRVARELSRLRKLGHRPATATELQALIAHFN